MATKKQPKQLEISDLLPTKPPVATDAIVALADLPPNSKLHSPDPSDEMVASVKVFGVIEPIILFGSKKTGFVVRAGKRRIKAARAAELTHIPARIYARDDGYLGHSLTLIENAQRSDNPFADYMAIKELVNGGATEALIQQALGLPLGTIRKRLELGRLPASLLTALGKGKITRSVAEAAAKLPPSLLAKAEQTLASTGTLTPRDLHDVKRVRQQEVIAALPDQLFTGPDAPRATWQAQAAAQLRIALRAIPPDMKHLTKPLTALLSELEGRPVA